MKQKRNTVELTLTAHQSLRNHRIDNTKELDRNREISEGKSKEKKARNCQYTKNRVVSEISKIFAEPTNGSRELCKQPGFPHACGLIYKATRHKALRN